MRTRWLLSLALGCCIALVRAQAMPACANDCLQKYLPRSSCDSTDFTCICSDSSLMNNVAECTLSSCTAKEGLSAKNATSTLCGDPVRDNTEVTPIVTAVSGVLAIVCVVLRITERLPGFDRFQWADLAVVLALVFAIPMGTLEFFMSSDGFGKDIWTIPFDKVSRIIKFTWLTEVFYMCVLGFTKVAILLLYLKVFPTQPFRNIARASVVLCAAYGPVFAFTIAFHCVPFSYGWTSWTGETQGHCFNLNAFAWAHAIINIILDLWVIFLPIPELLRLQLGRRKKIHLVLMFSVGLFITVVSIVRLTSLVRFANSTNPTWDNVPTAYWSVLEAFVSIICCCLPAIRSLLRRVFPTCFGSSSDPESQGHNYRMSTPMHSGDVKRTMGMGSMNTNVMPRSGDSDVIELVDKDEESSGMRNDWS